MLMVEMAVVVVAAQAGMSMPQVPVAQAEVR